MASSNILGISAFYHDSAACLVQDGEIVAAVSEERLTRKKGDPAFPFTDDEIKKYAIVISNEVSVKNQDAWVSAFTAALQ